MARYKTDEPQGPPTGDYSEAERLWEHAEVLRAEVELLQLELKGSFTREGREKQVAAIHAWDEARGAAADSARAAGHPRPGYYVYRHLRAVREDD